MKTLVGGAIAAVLGLIFLVAWHEPFFALLKGTVPALLLLGGGLSLYLGFDELKDTWKREAEISAVGVTDDKDKEIAELKKEVDSLKKEKKKKAKKK